MSEDEMLVHFLQFDGNENFVTRIPYFYSFDDIELFCFDVMFTYDNISKCFTSSD